MRARSFLMVVVVLFLFELQAQARIYVITDTSDTTKVTSLRGAIIDANRHGGNNTIMLGQQRRRLTYRLTLSGADEDAARTGDLDITRGNLTITGTGLSVVIDATGLGDRVFQVSSNARLTLLNLTIKGGTAAGSEQGGAIFNSGTLSIQNCSIVGNLSGNGGFSVIGFGLPGADGGGIYNEGFSRLDNCIISGNTAGAGAGPDNFGLGANGGNGGGIYNSGSMVLNNCTISANSGGQGGVGSLPSGWISIGAPGGPGGDGGCGAGIYNAGEMELNFCTVNGNGGGDGGDGGNSGGSGGNAGAGGSGAGIFNAGTLSLNTSTISGNFCGIGGTGGSGYFSSYGGALGGGVGGDGGNGGGVFNAGSLNSTSCTVSLNLAGAAGNGGSSVNADSGSGGSGGSGGGIVNVADGASISARNTLIALNSNGVGFGTDLAGDFTSQGYNLIGVADGSTGFVNGVNADQVGSIVSPIDPLIGPLQMNGGFTPTHALLWGSPAVDQGNCFGIHRDQRGHHRPHIYPSIPKPLGGDGSDIGAFEMGAH